MKNRRYTQVKITRDFRKTAMIYFYNYYAIYIKCLLDYTLRVRWLITHHYSP